MGISLLDRYQGALVGVLCGDALGAPYETWNRKDILTDFEKRGGLIPFDYENPWKTELPHLAGKILPAGRPTDDSDQTAALAQSLIACRGVNQIDLFNRLRNIVYGHVSPLWSGKAVGAGTNTRRMLKPETWEESKALDSSSDFPSNGSLMRSAPLGLFLGSYDPLDVALVEQASWVTHRHELVLDCCWTYVAVLTNLLEGYEPVKACDRRFGFDFKDPIIANSARVPVDPGKWPERGAAAFTLQTAIWGLVNFTTFREALTDVIAIGGDTDTYGAVAGGLLGAYYGIEGIPKEWRDALIGREIMIELADELYAMAQG